MPGNDPLEPSSSNRMENPLGLFPAIGQRIACAHGSRRQVAGLAVAGNPAEGVAVSADGVLRTHPYIHDVALYEGLFGEAT